MNMITTALLLFVLIAGSPPLSASANSIVYLVQVDSSGKVVATLGAFGSLLRLPR